MWEITLSTKQNVIEYLKYLPYPTLVGGIFLLICALFQLLTVLTATIVLLFYTLFFLLVFVFLGIGNPTTYIITEEYLLVQRGSDWKILSFQNVVNVTIKEGKRTASVLFQLKQGYPPFYHFKGITNLEYARTGYELIRDILHGEGEFVKTKNDAFEE